MNITLNAPAQGTRKNTRLNRVALVGGIALSVAAVAGAIGFTGSSNPSGTTTVVSTAGYLADGKAPTYVVGYGDANHLEIIWIGVPFAENSVRASSSPEEDGVKAWLSIQRSQGASQPAFAAASSAEEGDLALWLATRHPAITTEVR